jgi:hypothetical protein
MISARKPSVIYINFLIISGRILERDHSNANIIVASNILKLEIEISITYRVKIEKDRIYFIAEKHEIFKMHKF